MSLSFYSCLHSPKKCKYIFKIHMYKIAHEKKISKGKMLVAQLCLTLCHSVECSPPGSSDHGILQVRILEWVAIPFSRGIFLTQGLDPGLLHCRQILNHLNYQGSLLLKSRINNTLKYIHILHIPLSLKKYLFGLFGCIRS